MILYASREDRQYQACKISAIKFTGVHLVCPLSRFSTPVVSNRQHIQPIRFLILFIVLVIILFKMADFSEAFWNNENEENLIFYWSENRRIFDVQSKNYIR